MNYIIKNLLIDRLSYDNYMNIYQYIEEYNEHPLAIQIRQYFFKKRFESIHRIIKNMFYLAYYTDSTLTDKPIQVKVFAISVNNFYIKNTLCSYCGNYATHHKPTICCNCDAYSDLPNLYPLHHLHNE